MRRLFELLALLSVVILLLAGYLGYGLALGFLWMVFRIGGAEKNAHKQHAVTYDLLYILTLDLTPKEKQVAARTYIDELNAEREKQRKDWLYKLQNFGLKEDDPRWVK